VKRRVFVAIVLAMAATTASIGVAAEDPTLRDEFGLKPDDGTDKDLSLPDPVLDRNWPMTGPGGDPPSVAPDEDEIDPFNDESAPPVERPPATSEVEKPKLPTRPLVGPDGKLDFGSPAPEIDPVPADILEPEIDEPSEIDDEDRAPSPLDRGDTDFHDETRDPGDW
jgi:hypothetical protein